MSVLRWDGTVTATSSIAHGGQALGPVTYLRRERFLLADGQLDDIPVISGNAVRGLLRDTAADLWWDAAGKPPLTLAVQHAIWGGGALAKRSGPALLGPRLAAVKTACPVIGVFGAAGGGRIIDGVLNVGKLVPICVETAHVLPEPLRETATASIWDLTQIEYYHRVVDASRGSDELLELDGGSDDVISPGRFGVETFITGTRFATWMTLRWPTDAEHAFFAEALAAYAADARVGGMARAGHGRLRLDLTETTGAAPSTTDWRALLPPTTQLPLILAALD